MSHEAHFTIGLASIVELCYLCYRYCSHINVEDTYTSQDTKNVVVKLKLVCHRCELNLHSETNSKE